MNSWKSSDRLVKAVQSQQIKPKAQVISRINSQNDERILNLVKKYSPLGKIE
jgi:hypothetical protein